MTSAEGGLSAGAAVATDTVRDSVVVAAKIHPAIGIARVGNAETCYFVGPEVVDPPPAEPNQRRDEQTGALKRQAARFRIYGYNKAGEVVAELTADTAQIEWQVELANHKAAWYQFQIALDIPEATTSTPSALRNKKETDRAKLTIQGGRRSISGTNAPGAGTTVSFEGKFYDEPVYLGELKTDEGGRLIVLGGHGKSGGSGPLTTFANNDGWYDDASDGPVTAIVTIGGQHVPVDPAWVVVAPPNYAPDLKGVCTLYDALVDVFTATGALTPPAEVSFSRDILPIFQRLAGLQWVNAGYAAAFGYGGWLDFLTPEMIARLADNSAPARAWRSQIAHSFRDYDRDGWSPDPWPWIYGDAMTLPFSQTPRQNSRLATSQLYCLQRWADGSFVSDYPPPPAPSEIADVPLAWQPAMLDRAALDFCLADVFHPGCEVTWPVRHPTMYMAPFRIRHRAPDEKQPDLDDVLTPVNVLTANGPLYGQLAGWLTRWMAVPWQADAASCRSQASYGPQYDPYVPTFWPARVPNQVVSEASYQAVMDESKKWPERVAAFRARDDWYLLTMAKADQIGQMVKLYGDMGVVTRRAGIADNAEIPPEIFVSDSRKPAVPHAAQPLAETVSGGPAMPPTRGFVERLGLFPDESEQ